jgi:hypothetical protein
MNSKHQSSALSGISNLAPSFVFWHCIAAALKNEQRSNIT